MSIKGKKKNFPQISASFIADCVLCALFSHKRPWPWRLHTRQMSDILIGFCVFIGDLKWKKREVRRLNHSTISQAIYDDNKKEHICIISWSGNNNERQRRQVLTWAVWSRPFGCASNRRRWRILAHCFPEWLGTQLFHSIWFGRTSTSNQKLIEHSRSFRIVIKWCTRNGRPSTTTVVLASVDWVRRWEPAQSGHQTSEQKNPNDLNYSNYPAAIATATGSGMQWIPARPFDAIDTDEQDSGSKCSMILISITSINRNIIYL